MPLKPNMTLEEAKEFLRGDLKESIKNDIHPVLQPDKEEGGYFAVACLVLCYVDFLGALYCGYQGQKSRNGKKKIATSQKTLCFIKKALGSVDPHYKDHDSADLLYDMYRHGTVHLYAPKVLKRKRDSRELRWLLYKGEREKWEIANRRAVKVRHMQPTTKDAGCDWLPVSINCLYDDLNAAIDEFSALLDSDTALLTKWNQVAAALCEAEETCLDWSTERSGSPPPAGQRP